MAAAILLTILAPLAACGGGSDDGIKDTDPIDCRATPEVCI